MGKVEKNRIIPHKIIMNTLFEKVLTEQSAREPEETETLAAVQNEFLSWE